MNAGRRISRRIASASPSGLVGAVDRALQNGEFVAAPTRDQVAVARDRLQAAGDRGQQLVAAGVTEAVVDLLEVVEVDEQHVGGFAAVDARPQRCGELLFETPAVGQIGDRIDARQAVDRAGGIAALGDVLHDDDRALDAHPMDGDFDRPIVAGFERRDDVDAAVLGLRQGLPDPLDLARRDDLPAHQLARRRRAGLALAARRRRRDGRG